jgi:predicted 3-demethylubiquinone-9 3-methyltransferase (glyoxalase superfamily)
MPRITTFLAYDDRAEEAAKFYVSIFKNSKILKTTHYGTAGTPSRRRP